MKKVYLNILREEKKEPSSWLIAVQKAYLKQIGLTMEEVQKNLKLPQTGNFDSQTFKAIADYQKENEERIIELGDPTPIDKIYGPITHRVYLENTGQYEEAEKITSYTELNPDQIDMRFNPKNMNQFDESQILVVGDSTAVGVASVLPREYTGGLTKRQFQYKEDGPTESLQTLKNMPTAISGARTGLVLYNLENSIDNIMKNLGHSELEKKLMLIHVGGNDSVWYRQQLAKKFKSSTDASRYSNQAVHDAEFTFNNIMFMAKLGEEKGYEVRIAVLRPRTGGKYRNYWIKNDPQGHEEEHRRGVNKLLRTSKYYLVNSNLEKSNLQDAVHASPAGSKTILNRSLSPLLSRNKKIKINVIKSPQVEDADKIPPLKDDIEFLQKVKRYAERHNADPEDFIAIMYHETGTRELSPSADNNGPRTGGCIGLIQFCPGPNAGQAVVGKTGIQLKKMTRVEQWDYVEKYLDQPSLSWKENPTLAEIYMAIFLPEFSRLSEDAVLASSDYSKVDQEVKNAKSKRWIFDVWKSNPANRNKEDDTIITKKDMAKNIENKPYPKNLFSILRNI